MGTTVFSGRINGGDLICWQIYGRDGWRCISNSHWAVPHANGISILIKQREGADYLALSWMMGGLGHVTSMNDRNERTADLQLGDELWQASVNR